MTCGSGFKPEPPLLLDCFEHDTMPSPAIPETKPVVLINLFTVDPANQQELVDLLVKATATSVRQIAGHGVTFAIDLA